MINDTKSHKLSKDNIHIASRRQCGPLESQNVATLSKYDQAGVYQQSKYYPRHSAMSVSTGVYWIGQSAERMYSLKVRFLVEAVSFDFAGDGGEIP